MVFGDLLCVRVHRGTTVSNVNIKIKDLAAELGVETKEIFRAAKEIDENHKSTGTVPESMVNKLKAHFQKQTAEKVEKEQPATQVRVRRRSANASSKEAEEASLPADDNQDIEQADSPAEAQNPLAVEKESEALSIKAEAQETLASDSTEGASEAETAQVEKEGLSEAKKKAPKKGKARPEPVAAKIISVPEAKEEKAQEEAPKVEETHAESQVAESVLPESAESALPESAESALPESAESAQDKNARPRPAASARPEGSSAPSLLPPVQDRQGNIVEDEVSPPYTPATKTQVRVISCPDPAQVREAKNAQERARAERQASNEGGDNRNRRFEDRGGDRPQRPRPSGPGGQGPPAGGINQFPAGGGVAAVPCGDGQSKKKRNKNQNRRDGFGQESFGQGRRRDEFSDDMPRFRGRKKTKRPAVQQAATQPLKAIKRKIRIEEAIRVADMAHQMGIKSNEIIKVLFNLGIMATINMALDIDTASVVAAEFDYEVEKTGFFEDDYLSETVPDAPENLRPRPPVVTIMGHVDHGKTSLLDAIRKTHVTDGEAGGITQHIGAYHVTTKRGDIVFLDTPGHEAFTAMRARGAQVTDIVVLVVAADDGVMEQTREAANHARAAGVPIMVAVNKMDKEGADPDRVLRELAELSLIPEDWGGDTVVAKVSAKTREGLDDLLELLALQADILELRANPDKLSRGHIVEAKLDKGRGPVATVLIQEGTLRQGDTFVCGVYSGRVRAMFNDQGRKVKEAGPSMPVEVQGFAGVPEAGEAFVSMADEKMARRIAESRAIKLRDRELAKESRITLETFLSRTPDMEEAQILNLVVKSDVQGSLEAIVDALQKESTDKVRINVVHGGTGAITESDILLASASDAIIIGFNVRPTAKVKDLADNENVDIRFYSIIYKLVDEVKSAMAGLLAPIVRENVLGQCEVREVISVPKIGAIAGCHVSDGKLVRNAGVRILRDGVVVHTGKISSLRRFKDDVREVAKGYECGVGLENFNDIKVGDIFEAFETVEETATL